jgi:cytochrome b
VRRTKAPPDQEISGETTTRILVWDWPTRVVHWSFVLLVFLAWITATEDQMDWHRYCGYALLGLIVFRLYWGVVGSAPSRFLNFVRGPKAFTAYLRTLPQRASPKWPGHNPLGALSVLALLTLLLTETALGLFAVDVDGIESGPLAIWVSFDVGRVCARWHHLIFNALLWLIGLHLAAVAFYAVYKRENLVGPMVHGRKALSPRDDVALRLWPRIGFGGALSIAVVWLTARAFKL